MGVIQDVERDPDILGETLLIIGRQVPTAHGKIIELLAVDGDGRLHVVELEQWRVRHRLL